MTDQTRQEFERWFATANVPVAHISIANRAYAAGRSAGLEEAAQIADYHHENHCTNNDHQYRNCGMAIATGIRDLLKAAAILKRKEGK